MLRVGWWLAVAWAAMYGVVATWGVLDLPYPGEIGGELLLYAVMLVVVGRYVRARTGEPWHELIPLRPVSLSLVIPVTLLALGGYVLSSELVRLCIALNVLPPEVIGLAAAGSGDEPSPEPTLFRALIATALLPAFFEEATMRGPVLQALAARMSKRRAIVVSALFFAITHFRIERMPDTFMLGLVFGWMAVRTGSLLPGMLAHALHNTVFVLYERGLLPVAGIETDPYGLLPPVLVWAAVALAVIGLAWIRTAKHGPRRGPLHVAVAPRNDISGYPSRPFAVAPAGRAPLW